VQAVAETLGCSVGAVKKYGARGLVSLQVAPELGALKE
jgi:DNA-directed RNA polymerase specialized sigma24 family protein